MKFRDDTKDIDNLTFQEIKQFCQENMIDSAKYFLDIKAVFYRDGQSLVTKKVKELIDYTFDEDKYLISKGIWYSFNQDYIDYLNNSLSEIETIYNDQYDFSNQDYNAFIGVKYFEEKNNEKYQNKAESEIKRRLKQKYYPERAYNLMRIKDGFKNYDRENMELKGHKFEVMDLYREDTIFAVKIGGSSQKLCVAVDQSISAMKAIKNRNHEDLEISISAVALWFVLERKNRLEEKNGKPNLADLNMLMLKTRVDEWKKQVLLCGYKPIIYINYRTE